MAAYHVVQESVVEGVVGWVCVVCYVVRDWCCGSISCCVGICCRECSWLGVRRMLRSEGFYETQGPTMKFIM